MWGLHQCEEGNVIAGWQTDSAEVDNCRGSMRGASSTAVEKKESKQTNKSVVDKIKISDPLKIDTNGRADWGEREETGEQEAHALCLFVHVLDRTKEGEDFRFLWGRMSHCHQWTSLPLPGQSTGYCAALLLMEVISVNYDTTRRRQRLLLVPCCADACLTKMLFLTLPHFTLLIVCPISSSWTSQRLWLIKSELCTTAAKQRFWCNQLWRKMSTGAPLLSGHRLCRVD